MPKIVDHAQRRDQIALVACRVVATHGFEQATIVRIARAAGYTTGMLAHYFDSKQEIILAALRLIMRRMEQRLTRPNQGETDLLSVLSEGLPIDARRLQECAFWMAFWGQVSSDRRLKRINAWVHREYLRLYRRCLEQQWPEWVGWHAARRDQVLRAVVVCINGLTASAVSSPSDWPADRQVRQLRLHLELLRDWASRVRVLTAGRRAGR
jgi:AcrR family transcriptional regulator